MKEYKNDWGIQFSHTIEEQMGVSLKQVLFLMIFMRILMDMVNFVNITYLPFLLLELLKIISLLSYILVCNIPKWSLILFFDHNK